MHETYVYRVGYRFAWRCLTCEAKADKKFRRRMDADDEANAHEELERVKNIIDGLH